MDKHATLLKMFSGCQYTKDIAAYYFPAVKTKETQLKAFKEKIADTEGMYKEMKAKGYKEGTKFLAPQIIAVIVKFWGMPDEVEVILAATREKR